LKMLQSAKTNLDYDFDFTVYKYLSTHKVVGDIKEITGRN